VHYYETVADMVRALTPEVVGHIDVIRKNAPSDAELDTPAIRHAARKALEAVKDAGAILDLNSAGYRKGLDTPYPAPWLVREAHAMGIPFCFGEDSHSVGDVGAGIEDARRYLLANGVTGITALNRRGGEVVREAVPLEA